ncbi:nitroreductase family protein [Apirhabdus apintestini]|nr:nitroreductase family protein [Enterobacteriaceae bacterium CA-0114]
MNIESIVRTRYTSKAYDPMRPLSAEQRQQLLDLLRFSPSSVNSQPWHFFIIESADAKARVKPAFGDLNGEKYRTRRSPSSSPLARTSTKRT